MIPVTCHVADFNLRPGFPLISDLSLNGRSISAHLREASGDSQIAISFDFSRRGRVPELVSPLGVTEDQMTDALARVLAPVQATPPSIGLLMTDALAKAPQQFGLMFDVDDGDGLGPRQGCAVFLTAIASAMGTDLTDSASREFISFIALHEVGHAFNLWHVGDDSIMQTNPQVGSLGTLKFEDTQRHFLSLASGSATAASVLPGAGCAAYGTRPAGFPSGDGQPAAAPSRRKRKLALQIGLSTNALWPFEPIELDVSLSLPKDAVRAVTVPNEIDPGYSSFQIWITRPDGARFRYRPAMRFCGRNGTLSIRPGLPYVRDIALGRQSGRYTFAVPGEYQVQAMFAMTSGDFIMSNVAKCTVKSSQPSSPEWLAAKAALDNDEVRRLLQYKRRAPSLQTYASLQRYAAEATTSPATSAAIHFAIGRALADTAASMAKHLDQALLQEGQRHLHLALESNSLSPKRVVEVNARL
jgi:hypothetical protein